MATPVKPGETILAGAIQPGDSITLAANLVPQPGDVIYS
jgi:hypothetical protein